MTQNSRFFQRGELVRTWPDHQSPVWSSLDEFAEVISISNGGLCLVLEDPHEVVFNYARIRPGVHINPNHYLVLAGSVVGYVWEGATMPLFKE